MIIIGGSNGIRKINVIIGHQDLDFGTGHFF